MTPTLLPYLTADERDLLAKAHLANLSIFHKTVPSALLALAEARKELAEARRALREVKRV